MIRTRIMFPMTPVENKITLASVGYERRTAENLVELLQANGVTVLIDVRLTPISRKKGLSKTALAAALQAADIEYVHARELGNPKENREPFRRGSQRARDRYIAHIQNGAAQAVQNVVAQARKQYVALLCYEREHNQCHRSCITDEISSHHSDLQIVEL